MRFFSFFFSLFFVLLRSLFCRFSLFLVSPRSLFCRFSLFLVLLLFCFASCRFFEPAAAALWTDRPEFALYGAAFNASQDRYKVEIRYVESLAQKLMDTKETPDIVVGSWLKSASTRRLFKPLDHLFKKKILLEKTFYPRLLALGVIDEKHYLLPVSFNLPALVFTRANGQLLSNPFTIGLEEMKTLGIAHNRAQNGVFTQMGFSPTWDTEFLYVGMCLFNADFHEEAPLAWDEDALDRGLGYIRGWTAENAAVREEEDFVFKYFYEPPAVLALSGRILFTYMNSAEFFTLPPERRGHLDFRWIAADESIPLSEETVYFGHYQHGKAQNAAEAFTDWFFRAETQQFLLEITKQQGLNETLFGISSGFSALQGVTEQVFPRFYPGLLGHIPPAPLLTPPRILPYTWTTLKERVLLPYLVEKVRSQTPDTVRPLKNQITDWYRINKEF